MAILTDEELDRLIGRMGLMRVSLQAGKGSVPQVLYIPIRVLKSKIEYGNTRVYVTPVSGEGFAWVNESRITFPKVKSTQATGR